jgi:hypothetical protein
MLVLRDLAVLRALRSYAFQSNSRSLEFRFSTAAAMKFWHALAGLYLSVFYLVSPSHSLKFIVHPQPIAGSSSLLLDMNGKLSEGISYTDGRYG